MPANVVPLIGTSLVVDGPPVGRPAATNNGVIMDHILAVFCFGGLAGGWLGYHIGAWAAATRAARSTYRTQRGLRR
jgi:hypothetical protein